MRVTTIDRVYTKNPIPVIEQFRQSNRKTYLLYGMENSIPINAPLPFNVVWTIRLGQEYKVLLNSYFK